MGIIGARVEGREAYFSFDITGEPVCLPLMISQISCRFGHYWSISRSPERRWRAFAPEKKAAGSARKAIANALKFW